MKFKEIGSNFSIEEIPKLQKETKINVSELNKFFEIEGADEYAY